MSEPLEIQIRYLLNQLGIHSGYRGYRYAVTGIIEVYNGASTGAELYEKIAADFKVAPRSVERRLYSVSKAVERNAPSFCKALYASASSSAIKVFLDACADWLRLCDVVPVADSRAALPEIRWRMKISP